MKFSECVAGICHGAIAHSVGELKYLAVRRLKKNSMMKTTNGTQEDKVLEVFQQALEGTLTHSDYINGPWINKQYFIRVMGLTQAGRAIYNLESMGYWIERKTERDKNGFTWLRLVPKQTLF